MNFTLKALALLAMVLVPIPSVAQPVPIDLGTLGGRNSIAEALNDHGQVVGFSTFANETYHAFSWTAAGGMVDLGTFGGSNSLPSDVNENGQGGGARHRGNGCFA